jgi:hemolysin type calcium-binding protein
MRRLLLAIAVVSVVSMYHAAPAVAAHADGCQNNPQDVWHGDGGPDDINDAQRGPADERDCWDSKGDPDTLSMQGANDWGYAGNGQDSVGGGADNDHLFGEDGPDDLFGGPGNDVIAGGGGGDDRCGVDPGETVTGCEIIF